MKQTKTTTQQNAKLAKTDPDSSPPQWKPRPPDQPVLRFSPTAWAKLQYFCHHGDTEIGGFGISRRDTLLAIEDFVTVKQRVSAVSVAFDDDAVADYFDAQVDAGRKLEQFFRLWLHTHPGNCPTPSATDEETFSRVFGGCDWAIMFILARGGQTYCRLRFNVGPGGAVLIPTNVDYSQPFTGSEHVAWEAEYQRNVQFEPIAAKVRRPPVHDLQNALDDPWSDDHNAIIRDHCADDLDATFNDDVFDFDFQNWR